MGATLCLPVWTAFMLIGSLLWAFYHLAGQSPPAAVTRADQVFPYFMVTQMPVGVAGMFLAALFGAAMSMLASDLNCLGLILVEDFYSHFFPRNTDAQRLRFGKLAVIVCGALGHRGRAPGSVPHTAPRSRSTTPLPPSLPAAWPGFSSRVPLARAPAALPRLPASSPT